ncbi:TrbG/VirB9 family P-type conjugative transfer protein [Francisella sp. TX07-6608]|uniref:TrbG/VirB9 family P-type conjugative transfer protein n=1 Tax=Francisella sp. TX07-6608 TaxID=573568 RepID=UPI0008F9A382|nr:TrbG/VirB9 family P-type conjugative transfer protein [Francisella sp. TX07-6608]OIN82954.1 conjugal transfer family protein [Francisella sp. TX07-6608]
MIKYINIIMVIFLSGCSALPQLPFGLNPNTQEKSFYNFDDTPKYTQSNYAPADFKLPPQPQVTVMTSKSFNDNPDMDKLYLKYLSTGQADNLQGNGIKTLSYSPYDIPLLECSPMQLCKVILEKGELINSINFGDQTRWKESTAYIGNEQAGDGSWVIMIQPNQSNISTTLDISTDKRMYRFKVISRAKIISQTVNFWYPQETLKYVTTQAQIRHNKELQQAQNVMPQYNIDLHHLNNNYSYSSPNDETPAWKPETVFDDGSKTFIKLPPISSRVAQPVFFIMQNGEQALANYRYTKPYIIYDGIFKEGVLLSGKGSEQQKINIFNKAYPSNGE